MPKKWKIIQKCAFGVDKRNRRCYDTHIETEPTPMGNARRKGSIGMKTSYSANCMMMPMMRMFSMCMLCHGENGHFLSETV